MRRLLIRPGAIGDCIVSLPALESLATPETEVWAASANVPLIRFAKRVRALSATGLDWLEIQAADAPAPLLDSLRSFDSIISWYGSNRPHFRQVTRRLRLPFRFFPALPPRGRTHAVDFYLEQARRACGRPVTPIPRIPVEPLTRPTDSRPIVIHPFSGSPTKNWPLESFQQLATQLEPSGPIAWIAGPEEELPGARRFRDLYELARWLATARLFIGNDSGIAHLAAAVGAPVLAVFGPTDERIWAPRGGRITVVRTARRGAPIESVSLEQVLATARASPLESG